MTEKLIKKILKKYGYDVVKIYPEQSGYRNKSYAVDVMHLYDSVRAKNILPLQRKRNLILYKNEQGIIKKIQNANAVSNFLAEQGIPSRKSLGKIIRLHDEKIERFACLYNYLPGETISWEAYNKEHIKLLGKAMSDMHFYLKDYSKKDKLESIDEIIKNQANKMIQYFKKEGVRNAMVRKLGLICNINFINKFVGAENLRPLQNIYSDQSIPLHMDLVRSNVLFDLDKNKDIFISGIIDFEKVAKGNRIFDIARTLAFLLVDCKYKDPVKIRKYFLISGYKKRELEDLPDLTHLNYLIYYFLTYDFYKFLRHNPYESLNSNEHFIRTKNFLLSKKILISCS
ncbi:MAG: phosphotransferase [Candidatus Dojkabacteria bacterium]|nr:phosphotransferase [Candidatus Dojkabacteria bacterium]MDQ7020976.1 phosphotransferase [Candidatus Dojkabacteria bacterium]